MTYNLAQQVHQDIEKENAKKIYEAELCDTVLNNLELPDTIKIQEYRENSPKIYVHNYTCDVSLKCEAETIQDAFEAMESMDAETLYLCRDGWLSIRPESKLHHKNDRESMTTESISEFYYQVDGLLGHKEEKCFIFYVIVKGYTVELNIEIIKDHITRRSYDYREFKGGHSVEDTTIIMDDRYFCYKQRMGRGTNEHPHRFYLWS